MKQEIYDEAEGLKSLCAEVCTTLWNNPETGGHEKKSADLFRDILEKEGFTIKNNENLEHAFMAEYGSGKPVIAVLGEYDALPGLSQKVSAVKEPVVEGGPGHGCGHNLLGSGALTGAIAIKRYLEKTGMPCTLRFYGCPEEELLSGKVKMAYYHMFDGCDIAITWHPMSANMVHDNAYLASASAKFYFTGKASHAAFAPQNGRSALDAVELMNVGCNYLREHVIDRTRIHYTTDSGGFAPNIVPAKASSWYFVRAPHITDVREILERIKKVAKGAAMMTETSVDIEVEYGCCEFHGNHAYSDLTQANLEEAGEIEYTPEELEFARELQNTVDKSIIERDMSLYKAKDSAMAVGAAPRDMWKTTPISASSDSGDVSFLMPANLFTTACMPIGCNVHTWQSTAATGSTLGQKGAFHAAKVIAGIAYDLLNQPETLEKIRKEFEETNTGTYKPMYKEDEE